ARGLAAWAPLVREHRALECFGAAQLGGLTRADLVRTRDAAGRRAARRQRLGAGLGAVGPGHRERVLTLRGHRDAARGLVGAPQVRVARAGWPAQLGRRARA